MNRSRRTALDIAMCAVIFALGSTVAHAASLKGKVKKGVYNSPAGNFTVPLPRGLGTHVSDGYLKDKDGHMGAVSFHDDFGGLIGIHYMSFPPDVTAALAKPGALEPGLKGWLETVAMQTWFVNAAPDSHLTHQAFGTFEGAGAIFAQVEIPGGSHLVTIDPGGKTKKLDSTRGLVVFTRGHYIYMLTTELRGLSDVLKSDDDKKAETAPDVDDKWLGFVDGLKGFYQSITFLE